VCDDVADVRRFISEFLASLGYDLHVANGGAEAVRLREGCPDIELLIVDCAMPGMNGLDTIRRARQRLPGRKSLLIIGDASGASRDIAGLPLLRKPFAPAEVAGRAAGMSAA
jgi:CheY-like chemotaxis protein